MLSFGVVVVARFLPQDLVVAWEERSCPGARLFKVVKIWGVRVRNPRGEVIE